MRIADDDFDIEWGFLQQQTKETQVPVSTAYNMTLLRETRQELGLQLTNGDAK